jgi:DNA replication protein DnaC
MLPNPTLDKLQTLRLHGMIKALSEQHATPDINDLSFDERLGLMVDRELTEREDARLTTRLKAARLRHNACLEDIDYRSPRGLDKALILQLGSGQWLRDGLNLIIGGPTGVGKHNHRLEVLTSNLDVPVFSLVLKPTEVLNTEARLDTLLGT